MYAYKSDHNWGSTLVLSDGRVFEERSQPGGGSEWYLVEEGVNPDDYTDDQYEKSEWTMLQDEVEISAYINLEEAENYFIGEKPRMRSVRRVPTKDK
jgi:hypothetical protein